MTDGGRTDADEDAKPTGAGPTDDVPFASLAHEAAERERRRAAADDHDPFESRGVPGFDGDVWDALADATAGDAGESGAAGEGAPTDGSERVVNKREYCQQCPHLAAPPVLSCTHEGTAIVEVLDGDDLRVRGCPVVDGSEGADEPGSSG